MTARARAASGPSVGASSVARARRSGHGDEVQPAVGRGGSEPQPLVGRGGGDELDTSQLRTDVGGQVCDDQRRRARFSLPRARTARIRTRRAATSRSSARAARRRAHASRRDTRDSARCACLPPTPARRRGGPRDRLRVDRRTGSRARRCRLPRRPPPQRGRASPASPSGRRRASSLRQHLGQVLVAPSGEAHQHELVLELEPACQCV